ncbi:MAG TPA: DUF305 domain-containing protein [Pyrinomonadaceae bacterium]|jgi:uncharacterized protein (DUF305 family)
MMKKENLLSLSLFITLAVCGAACSSQPAGSDHGAMNHNRDIHGGLNHNGLNNNAASQSPSSNADHQTNHAAMRSDRNAAAQAYDLQFIDTMTHHHEGAIEMSELALRNSSNEELKKFARKIIGDQRSEINRMKIWRAKWFNGKPSAVNMEMPGMADSMKMMTTGEMQKMEAATGAEFDRLFLEMMTAHHEGALVMAKDAAQKAERAELKTLAAEIVKAQEAEIEQMSDWRAQQSR